MGIVVTNPNLLSYDVLAPDIPSWNLDASFKNNLIEDTRVSSSLLDVIFWMHALAGRVTRNDLYLHLFYYVIEVPWVKLVWIKYIMPSRFFFFGLVHYV